MERKDTRIKILPADRFTPVALAKKLGAKVLLESSSYHKGRERYSLLMTDEAFSVIQRDGSCFLRRANGRESRIKTNAKDILDILMYFADQHTPPHQDFPFPAGGIGFLGYEFAAYCDDITFRDRPDPLGLPEAAFLFGHVFIVFDHYTDLLYLIGLNYKEAETDLEAALARTEAAITDLNFNYMLEGEREVAVEELTGEAERDAFKRGVEVIKDEIVKGNLLQGVLSRRMRFKTDMSGIEAYRRLRRTNPSPYLFYVDFGDYQLFGSSPEVHVKAKEGRATVRPIAGTRRRGVDRGEDMALEAELLADEKERAEHLMLVDLGRNDLGRVCRPGSVEVVEYMTVERYSRVMHIVSQVEGDLEEGKTGVDALRATFPAGTVSGAPKFRAIETVDRLEAHKRSFYAGVVGYLEPGGGLDTCIAIRSGLVKDGELVLQAGAGIVYDSNPERELEETSEKLSALLRSAGAEKADEEATDDSAVG